MRWRALTSHHRGRQAVLRPAAPMKKTLMILLTVVGFLLCCGQASTSVGALCAADSECDKGQSCFMTAEFPGGYCTKGCTREGEIMECPLGSICTRTTKNSLFCSTECKDNDGCRG